MTNNKSLNTTSVFQHADEAASLLKLVAHPHRLMILCLLSEGERNVTELVDALGINQTAVSNHLAKLRSEGVVEYTRYHRVLQYRIVSKRILVLLSTLCDFYHIRPGHKPAE